MTVALADFCTALETAWNTSGLNAKFQVLWDSSYTASDFTVYQQQEASPGQPFPYCIAEVGTVRATGRMSRSAASKWELKDVSVVFNIHTEKNASDIRSAKQLAAYLAEEVLKVFGGHPTVSPSTSELSLSNGGHIITQLAGESSERTDLNRHVWKLEYLFRLDVPVMV